MQTRIHTYTHIQIHSKHIRNFGLPYCGAGGISAYGNSATSVGALGVGALDAGAHVASGHNFDAHGKTPIFVIALTLPAFYQQA